ncbi:MAG: patatin-like phospholipase family protein [Ectothiorhodospiraceae bacterium]|nr:patatin-like phospholipase family protein [Ectothiorhodospiraceae bacterium]
MPRRSHHALLSALLAGALGLLSAAPGLAAAETTPDRPVVGLVLGGGGAKGIAHVGVLQVLEELQVPVDLVVGTSMGAIVGGLYAQGLSPRELQNLVVDMDWQDAFRDDPARRFRSLRRKAEDWGFPRQVTLGVSRDALLLPPGLLQGQRLTAILRELSLDSAHITDFDRLPLPFRATAVDIQSGEVLALGSGDLALAMRASMSIPGAIAPVKWEGRLLVDGGIANNLPVDLARAMGAEVVIAVDVGGDGLEVSELTGPFSVMEQTSHLMIRQNVAQQIATLKPTDLYVRPDLTGIRIGTADFDRAEEAIVAGALAARSERQRLLELAVDDAAWERHLARQRRGEPAVRRVDFIRLDNQSRLRDELLLSRIHSEPGEPLDPETLNADMERLYGLGYFERVDYRYVEEDGRGGLEVTAVPRSWGPRYLRFGLALEDDFDSSSNYRAGVSYLLTEVNRLGAEFQADLEVGSEPGLHLGYWQPFRRDARAYVTPWAELRRQDRNIFDAGDQVGRYRITRYELGLAVGREFGNITDLRLGYQFGGGRARARIQPPDLPRHDSFTTGIAFIELTLDRLDNPLLPRSGGYLSLRYDYSDEALGADDDFQRVSVQLLGAVSQERNTWLAGARLGSFTSGEAPIHELYTLGGFMNLSGFQRDALTGTHLAHTRLAYLRQITGYRTLGGLPVFLGGALEAGNVWDDEEPRSLDDLIPAASLIGVILTPIGALHLGVSQAEAGRHAGYLSLGQVF